MIRSALLLLALAVPVSAASGIRLAGGAKSENALRRFIQRDPKLKLRFEEAARREEAFLAESRESGLRDAVSDFAPSRPADLIASMPGMRLPPAPTCATLSDCPVPDLAMDAADADSLPETVRRMVRPWMLLQEARGSKVELTPADGAGDAALIVRLQDLDSAPLTINVTPKLLGGFKVWFDQPLALAALYGRERDTVLSK